MSFFFVLLQEDVALVNASVYALHQQASSRSIHASYTPLCVHASYTPRVRGAYTPLTRLSVCTPLTRLSVCPAAAGELRVRGAHALAYIQYVKHKNTNIKNI